jgi:hypothetical protein
MTSLRILITGSRDWRDKRAIADALRWAITTRQPRPTKHQVTIVHGAARGADTLAGEIAASWGVHVEPHAVTSVDWNGPCVPQCPPGHRLQRRDGSTFCPAVAKRRNQRMVDLGADICLAFPLSAGWSGTRDCMTRADAAGIRVVDWPNEQPTGGAR